MFKVNPLLEVKNETTAMNSFFNSLRDKETTGGLKHLTVSDDFNAIATAPSSRSHIPSPFRVLIDFPHPHYQLY